MLLNKNFELKKDFFDNKESFTVQINNFPFGKLILSEQVELKDLSQLNLDTVKVSVNLYQIDIRPLSVQFSSLLFNPFYEKKEWRASFTFEDAQGATVKKFYDIEMPMISPLKEVLIF